MTPAEIIYGSLNTLVVGCAIYFAKTMWDKMQVLCKDNSKILERLKNIGDQTRDTVRESRRNHDAILYLSGKLNLIRLTVETESGKKIETTDWDIGRRFGAINGGSS